MAPQAAELAARALDDEDLVTLLRELRDAGFAIGVPEHLQAFELAAACRRPDGTVDPRRLRNWLAPALCTRAEEQEAFYRRFEAWWRRTAPEPEPEPPPEPPVPSELERDLERMRPGRWVAALAGSIVLLALALYLAHGWLGLDEQRTEVPDLIGTTELDARGALAAAGLDVSIEGRIVSALSEGSVARQVPKAGERVEPATVVQLWLARAIAPVEVPEVVGLEVEEAIERLAERGLEVLTQETLPSERTEGTVVVQQPEAGEQAAPGPVMRLWIAEPARHAQLVRVTGRVVDDDGRAVGGATVSVSEVLQGHSDTVWSASFSPDGRRVLTASYDGTARVWPTDGLTEPIILTAGDRPAPIRHASFSPDGRLALTLSEDGSIRVWDPDGGDPVLTVDALAGTEVAEEPWRAGFAADGQSVVALYSGDSANRAWTIDGRPAGTGEVAPALGHEPFSKDRARYVMGGSTPTILGYGRNLQLRGHTDFATGIFSPDDSKIATASFDRTARVWSADGSGAPLVLVGHTAAVYDIAFDPEGTRVVTASGDDTARVWSFGATNDTGGFSIEAPRSARPRTVQLAHDDHLAPAEPCEVPAGPGELVVEARLAPIGTVWTRWLERNRAELAYGLGLLPLLAAGTWWGWKRRRRELVLERRASRDIRAVAGVPLPEPRHGLFRGRDFLRARIEARRRYAIGPGDLDADRTIEQTVRRLGYFTPVYRSRLRLPVYLALIDRAAFGDQQARFVDELLDQLVEGGVAVDRYRFDRDPRLCASADHPGRNRIGLRALAGRHPEHWLLVFGDGDGLFDPVTGRLASWTGLLAAWKERAILTPVAACHWGPREGELTAAGFRVVPATPEGLLRFAEAPAAAAGESSADGWRPPLPRVFAEYPERWLGRNPPPPETLDELSRQLRLYLGPDGYRWLAALAVYPGLDWFLTLYLGLRLENAQGAPLLSETALLDLTRLPWLRQGSMPDWLRLRLISDLSKEDETTVRAFLYELLRSKLEAPESRFALDVARPPDYAARRRWRRFAGDLVRTEPSDSALQDRVFVDFLMGKRPSKLQLLAPATWQRWIWEGGIRSLGPRPVAGLCLAAALGAAAFFGAPAAIAGLNDLATTGEPSTVSCQWNTAQVPVPDLLGLSRLEATFRLEELGLTAGTVTGDEPAAVVVAQQPSSATPAALGSEVTLELGRASGQSDLTTVPDVTGFDLGKAGAILKNADLVLRLDPSSAAAVYGPVTVTWQRPPAGSRVARGNEVLVGFQSLDPGGTAPHAAVAPPAPMAAGAMQLDDVRGSVEVQVAGEDRWRPAEAGDELEEGARVRTRSDGSVTLRSEDGSERVLGPNGSLRIAPGGLAIELQGNLVGRISNETTCRIGTGPIADDKDAAERCAVACKPIGGWTGNWWSPEAGKLSICRCSIDDVNLDWIPFDPKQENVDCQSLCRANHRWGGVRSPLADECICTRARLDCELEVGLEFSTPTATIGIEG